MAAGAYSQINIRLGHAQVIKKGLAHFLVIALTGMHQQVLDFIRIAVHDLDDRRYFYEIRTRTNHVEYFQIIFLSRFHHP